MTVRTVTPYVKNMVWEILLIPVWGIDVKKNRKAFEEQKWH